MGTGSITVVVPTYGVAAYLPAFLTSLDDQDLDGADVEFVFVDDGSPDDSAAIIEDWIAQRPALRASLLRKANGGLASARNAGLDAATGEWVTFADPDDMLDKGYLAEISRFVTSPEADTVHVVTGRPILFDDPASGTTDGRVAPIVRRDEHPLRYRFHGGTRVVDLVRYPLSFHVAANTGFFRRAVLDRFGLRFDGGVRPVWEDGHLTARYLSKFTRPRVAMMAKAHYLYRQRADRSSLMDGQWRDPDKFVTVPSKGWLDALRIGAAEHGGRAPEWLQNMVVYDVRGYFKSERVSPSPTAGLPREVSDEFFRILHDCFSYIDLDVLDRFRGLHLSDEVREGLRVGFAGADPRPSEIAVDRLDEARGLVRLRYFYAGDTPVEQWRVGGLVVAPVHAKTRPSRFYGHTLAVERIVWLPADDIVSVALDGIAVPLRIGPPELRRLDLRPSRIREALAGPGPLPAPPSPGVRPRLGHVARTLRRRAGQVRDDVEQGRATAHTTLTLSRTTRYRRKYLDAWLLTDDDRRAGGDAETLYRWLRAHRPQVNAWFVLPAGSPDRARLAGEGFRLLETGSREHDLALLGAAHVVSSRLDTAAGELSPALASAIVEDHGAAGGSRHRTYLPPEVTVADRSVDWNRAEPDLVVTASPAEHRAVVDDTSPYVLGTHEVELTGHPRHDRLLELARDTGAPELVLLAPTGPELSAAWREVLGSDELRRAAAVEGYRVRNLPAGATGDEIGRVLARTAVLVTDDAALSFEAAYLARAVVYLQPPADATATGWWTADGDGFGPVTADAPAALAAVRELITRRGVPAPGHAERMAAAFAFRDGESCRRTYEAVVALTVPLSRDERYLTLEPRDVLDGRPVADEWGA